MPFLLPVVMAASLASGPSCTPVPLYEAGRMVDTICAESVPDDMAVLDLTDDWAPRLFSETPEYPLSYRERFVKLANERLATTRDWDTARRDRYYELFGIFPSLGVLRGRLADLPRHNCHAAIDDTALVGLGGRSPGLAALVPGVVAAIHGHLRCDGLLPSHVPAATTVAVNRPVLALYQRRHMIPAGGRFDQETLAALTTDSRELDFRALLRTLRERVVDATGFIEDGSSANAWETVLGRHLDAPEYRTLLRAAPLARGAPDLVARATEAAAIALGWTSATAAETSLQQGLAPRIATRTPPAPAYHGPHMQLRAEIDRGDVWNERPDDATGRRRPSPVRRRPTMVLYATTADGEIPLVRWPTTIGGWQPEKHADGSLGLEYKPSPVGRRYWRDLLAAPAWFPPPTTPDRELVRWRADGTWTTDDDAVGPGYRSAYGLVALVHHRADVALDGGSPRFTDIQIRSHGSGNYRSILRGSSHGCHRLFNHLALRLGSFLLRHHDHIRHGPMDEPYARLIPWKERSLVLRAKTRGYRYELVPPIPVDVLPGRTVRSRRLESVPNPSKAEDSASAKLDSSRILP